MTKILKSQNKYYMVEDGEQFELSEKSLEKKTGIWWYKLPENSSNRKLVSDKLLLSMKENEEIELKYRETRVIGPRLSNGPRKNFTEYMTPEELTQYNRLIELAKGRKIESEKKTPLSEKEKLQLKIEKLKKELEKLSNEEVED